MPAGACWSVLLSVLLGGAGSHYPLAAAQVIGGKLVIADVPTRTLLPVPLEGFVSEEADLTPDKKYLAVVAHDQASHLFLVEAGTWERTEVAQDLPGLRMHPRFGDMGKVLFFTTAPQGSDGPKVRHRYVLATQEVTQISEASEKSESSTVGLAGGAVAYFVEKRERRELVVPTRSTSTTFGPKADLTASPDGARLVVFERKGKQLQVTLFDSDGKTSTLGSFKLTEDVPPHPRFICPRDVVFTMNRHVWALSSKTKDLTDLMPATCN